MWHYKHECDCPITWALSDERIPSINGGIASKDLHVYLQKQYCYYHLVLNVGDTYKSCFNFF